MNLILSTLKSIILSESSFVSIHVIDEFNAESCAWTSYMSSLLKSEGIRTIDRKSLIFKNEIQSNVDVVELKHDDQLYIHKYMNPYNFTYILHY